jgi:hypothetical protein
MKEVDEGRKEGRKEGRRRMEGFIVVPSIASEPSI